MPGATGEWEDDGGTVDESPTDATTSSEYYKNTLANDLKGAYDHPFDNLFLAWGVATDSLTRAIGVKTDIAAHIYATTAKDFGDLTDPSELERRAIAVEEAHTPSGLASIARDQLATEVKNAVPDLPGKSTVVVFILAIVATVAFFYSLAKRI